MDPGKFVYHGAPQRLTGNRLVSLFALEDLDPAAYRHELAKYAGRESAPAFAIPGFGVRFNDTVHCAPIHPWYIVQARVAEGLPATGPLVERPCYRIPIDSIVDSVVIWYQARTIWLNAAPGQAGNVAAEPPVEEFEPFEADRYTELTAIPAAYRPRVRATIAEGRRPLTFVHVPHVLVAGAIDLASAEVVDPLTPPDWESPSR